jgi:hypothetical protein
LVLGLPFGLPIFAAGAGGGGAGCSSNSFTMPWLLASLSFGAKWFWDGIV